MAGLLLGDYNILVLDEPGNHLDVETVEALAEALLAYNGTVIFTAHDRHFVNRIATAIIEVRDGTVKNYVGDYNPYVYRINKEIEAGDRESNNPRGASRTPSDKLGSTSQPLSQNKQRELKKKIKSIERRIARLDEERKSLKEAMLSVTDPEEAMRIHEKMEAVTKELSGAEEEWLELS